MRPGQNNNNNNKQRMRGRNNNNNNNRKGPNPLTRAYESNGPDVKIRGTAQHITEKYLQLARDAQASGDIVVAENYLQHAEHYYRIISTAQAAQAQAQMGYGGRPGEEVDEVDEDDDFVALPDRFASPFERNAPVAPVGQNGQPIIPNPMNPNPMNPNPMNASQMAMGQPQPYLERPAFSNEFSDRPQNNGERQERPERQDRPDRQDRPHRNDRRFNPQGNVQQGNGPGTPQGGERVERDRNDPRGDRNTQPNRNRFRDQPRFEAPPEAREQPDVDFGAMSALPAFITAPVRPVAPPAPAPQQEANVDEPRAFAPPAPTVAPAPVVEAPAAAESVASPPVADEGEAGLTLRPRRRRRPRAEEPTEEGPAPAPEASSAE